MKSINLSDEAHEIITGIAGYLKISKRAAAEFMILNFSPSTRKERQYQQATKKIAYQDFINRNMDTDLPENLSTTVSDARLKYWLKQAWSNGYGAGWKDFQTRKFCSLGLEVPE